MSPPQSIEILRAALRAVIAAHPFAIEAIVILPDHLHSIWTLPKGDADFSTRWRLIKSYFSRNYSGNEPFANSARKHKGERAVWQRRFWERRIRDEVDLMRHVEYIHYNPVKHGLVKVPGDWPYSSFHRYVRDGFYGADWGKGIHIEFEDEIGKE